MGKYKIIQQPTLNWKTRRKNEDKNKRNHTYALTNQTVQNKDKEKIVKTSEDKRYLYIPSQETPPKKDTLHTKEQ